MKNLVGESPAFLLLRPSGAGSWSLLLAGVGSERGVGQTRTGLCLTDLKFAPRIQK